VLIKISVTLAAALLAACATHPPAPAPTAVPPATHVKAIGGGLAAVPPEQKAAVNQDLIKRGYLARLYRGDIVYCREERVTGSMFQSLNCQSEEHLQTIEQNVSREMRTTGGSSCGHVGGPSC
jgi:hypothetical protein